METGNFFLGTKHGKLHRIWGQNIIMGARILLRWNLPLDTNFLKQKKLQWNSDLQKKNYFKEYFKLVASHCAAVKHFKHLYYYKAK